MKASKLLWKTASLCGFASLSPALFGQGQGQSQPNIVIILADDMGYGDVSYNNPLARTSTPNIDRLAQNGVRFTDAHSGGAVSIPSRYGLVTGRYFFRAEKRSSYWGYLDPLIEIGRETIGSVLQKSGYTTACIGKWHLGLEWERLEESRPLITHGRSLGFTNADFHKPVKNGPNDLGFDYSFILPASLDMPPYAFLRNGQAIDPEIVLTAEAYPKKLDRTLYAWDKKHVSDNDVYWDRGVWWRNGEMSKSFKVEDCLDVIVDEGLSFIERQQKENPQKPFMLYLPLTGPHTPWMPNEQFKNTSEMGTYGDFISQIDNVVLRVTELLKQLQIDDNTIVIFASDNGSAWEEEDVLIYGHSSNGHWRGQKGDAWEGGHHIPLIIQWPAKMKKGRDYSHTTSLIDLLATFAEMTNQPLSPQHAEDSFSFYNVLQGKQTKANRDHLVYISSSGKLAITQGDWKYIDAVGSAGFTYPTNKPTVPGGPKGQLYNLKEDPVEENNLYLRNPEKVEALSSLMKQVVEKGHSR